MTAARSFILLGLVAAGGRAAAAPPADPRALEVATRLEQAMGGRNAFDAQRVLIFRFVVERDGKPAADWLHCWDRWTGHYRLEGEKDGVPLRVLMNVNDRKGEVWRGGTRLSPEDAAPILEEGYGRFINDSYWLLMPWKWRDPGVALRYEGSRTAEGETFDVVSLAFDAGIGLTSRDRYWAWVSRKDGLMKRWEFVLQTEDGKPGSGEPTLFTWEDWREGKDGLRFARRKTKAGAGPSLAITFPLVETSREVDASTFAPPPPPAGSAPAEPTGTPPDRAGLSTLLVVLSKSDHYAALVDPGTGAVIRKVPTGIGPHEAAVSRDGRTLYVSNYGTGRPGNTLSVIDLPSGTSVRTIDLGENRRPHGLAVALDGALWVTTEESRSVLRLSGEDLSQRTIFETGEEVTHMVVLAPDGVRAYTANIGSGTVSMIDGALGTVKSVPTGSGPEGIDLSPDGTELWVAHRNDDTIVILDAKTLEIKRTLPTGDFPIRVRFTRDGKRVLVSCAESNQLVVYDAPSRKEAVRLGLEAVPVGILVPPLGNTAYVANTQADRVSVIDLDRLVVTGSLDVGREPDGMAWAAW